MAQYRIALNTSAYPGRRRGELIEVDPEDPDTQARVKAGVLSPVGDTPLPAPPEDPPEDPAEGRSSRRGRRGAAQDTSGDDTAAETPTEGDDGEAGEGAAADS